MGRPSGGDVAGGLAASPFLLVSGDTIICPYDGRQPYIAKPSFVRMADNVAWATNMRNEYLKFADSVIRSSPQAATAIPGYRSGQAAKFAQAVAQNGQFDYQRPPHADLFLTFYTSFASYNFGALGYFAGFTLDHLLEGGGSQNWFHATWDKITHRGRTRIDTSGASGLSQLNEWCVRRAFKDCEQQQVA